MKLRITVAGGDLVDVEAASYEIDEGVLYLYYAVTDPKGRQVHKVYKTFSPAGWLELTLLDRS